MHGSRMRGAGLDGSGLDGSFVGACSKIQLVLVVVSLGVVSTWCGAAADQRTAIEPPLPPPPPVEVIEVPPTPPRSPAALRQGKHGGAVRYDEFGLVPGAGEGQLSLPDPVLDPDWPVPEPEAVAAEPEPEPAVEKPVIVPGLPQDWRIDDRPAVRATDVSETDLALDRRPEFAEDHWAGPEEGEPLEELGSFEPMPEPQLEE